LDGKTTRDADAAEMAALYRRVEDARNVFYDRMSELLTSWQELLAARTARAAFRAAYRAKYQLGGN
jgi:hypothetical protein